MTTPLIISEEKLLRCSKTIKINFGGKTAFYSKQQHTFITPKLSHRQLITYALYHRNNRKK